MNTGVGAITDKILGEAKTWANEQTSAAKVEAENTADEFTAKAKEQVEKTLDEANEKAKAAGERAISQGEMDRRKMLLAAKQECVDKAFEQALQKMSTLPDEEKVLLMVRSAVKYQTTDAQYIFSQADQQTVGPLVVETVNAIFKKQQLKDTFSGSVKEMLSKLLTSEKPFKAELSQKVGNFAGGFILKQGDIESNCTFEVLIGGVREELEGEVSTILFS